MSNVIKYLKIVSIYSRNSIKNRSNLVVGLVTMFARCAITLLLYSYAYKVNNNNISNSTFVESAWSMFLYFSFMMFSLRKIFVSIETDILSGSIEVYITKPLDYIKYNVLKKIGEDIAIFLIVTLVGSIFMIILVGIPNNFSIFTLGSIFITLILGIIIALILYSIIGLLAFYIQKVRSLYSIIDKFVMVLGGSYLPIALFPKIMKDFATYSPFGAVNFLTSTVYETWKSEYIIKIFMQVIWIIILYGVLMLLYKKAKERLAVNGG